MRLPERSWTCIVALALVCVAMITPAWAQRSDGTLRGTVVDAQGAALPGATITVTNENTGVTFTTTTSNVGVYNVPNLPIGRYTVKIESKGFATHTRTQVEMFATQVIEVNATMHVGAGAETVEVRAGADIVQTQSSQLSSTFTTRLVDVPVTGGAGSVLNLSWVLPNTTTQIGGTSGTGGSVGGVRARYNSFSVDGANNDDPSVTIASQHVISDAVAEFTLNSNVFSAEYGRGTGGQFNVVTKTGTNNLHFNAWWYNVNRHLNASDNFEEAQIKAGTRKEKKRYDYNRAGGDIGGAIIPNKLFYYGAYEYRTEGSQGSTPAFKAPTQQGMTVLNSLAVNQQVKDLLGQFPVAGSASGTPLTVKGQPVPIGDVTADAPQYFNTHDYLINIDYNMTNHQIRGRHMKARTREPGFGIFPQPQFSSNVETDNRKIIFNEVWTVNPRLVNDFKASMSRLVSRYPLEGLAANYPTLIFDQLSNIWIGPANNFPQRRTTNQYSIVDNINYMVGRHNMKWGGEYRWFTSPSEFLQNARGQYRYATLDLLVDDLTPTDAGQTLQGIGDGTFAGNAKNFSFFFQDDVKVNRRLTLNLGIRYDYMGIPAGSRLNAKNSVSDLPGTILIWRVPGTDKNNWSPRFGFALDPTGSGKWAVRGGIGVGYDVIPFNFQTNGAPPQKQAILRPSTACVGTFSAPPAWCATGSGFLANGAMKVAFIEPTNQALARSITGNLMADAIAPKTVSWSLSVQREIMHNTSVEIRYLGTRATQLPVQIQLNSITAFERGAQPLPTYIQQSEIPASVALNAPSLSQFQALVGTGANRRYGAAGFRDVITSFLPVGASTYHGGAVEFNRRFTDGLMLRANYTYAKTLDNSTNDLFTSTVNPRRPENAYDMSNEWGRSALDIRHKLALSWVYDVPKLNVDNGFLKAVFHGWQYNGTWLLQSGSPVTIQSGADANGNGDSAGDRAIFNPNGVERTGTTVNFVCRNATTGATSVATSAANCGGAANVVGYVAKDPTAQFIQAQPGAVTNIGRNTVDSDGFNMWNMSLFKNNKLSERFNLQFRFETYNTFNRRHYTLGPATVFGTTTNATSASYSSLTGGSNFLNPKQFNGGGRQIQLGMKLMF